MIALTLYSGKATERRRVKRGVYSMCVITLSIRIGFYLSICSYSLFPFFGFVVVVTPTNIVYIYATEKDVACDISWWIFEEATAVMSACRCGYM